MPLGVWKARGQAFSSGGWVVAAAGFALAAAALASVGFWVAPWVAGAAVWAITDVMGWASNATAVTRAILARPDW
jgi:hypothetical protein